MDSIDKQLDIILRKPETPIGDDGFSEGVVNRLPKRRRSREKCRSWTLAGAAAIGSILTLILVPPIETALKLFETLSAYLILMFAVFLVITISAFPLAWLLYSRFVSSPWEPAIPRPRSFFRGGPPRF